MKEFPANHQSFWCNNISTLTIFKQNQRNICSSCWIVFQALNYSRNIKFIPFKINNTVVLLMTTTNMTRCYTPLIITTATFTILHSKGAYGFAFM